MHSFYGDILELASRIERQWLKFQYSSDDFYKIAWEQTENFDFGPLREVANQLDLLDEHFVRYVQQSSTFSDLYFKIFENGRFLIEVLNWSGSHVNVHDHDFSGVQFQLKGNALNVVYDFEVTESLGAVRFGDLRVRKAEILKEGGRSIVRHGALDPHAVSHLSSPTTSLLVRTLPTKRYGAQSNYFQTLAAHYYVNTDLQRKKLTGLSLCAQHAREEFRRLLVKFLATQSLSENLFMLVKLGEMPFQEDFVGIVSDYAQRGEHESKVVKSVAYNNAIDFFKNLTRRLSDEGEKLALFAVAASHGRDAYFKVEGDLAQRGVSLDTAAHLRSIGARLSSRERAMAGRYLEMFGLADLGLTERWAA
jgi:hypothetical protein